MQFSPTCYHFISLRSKYSPQHPVLKHPQFIPAIFNWCDAKSPQVCRGSMDKRRNLSRDRR
jgi:hypothetical protein